MTQQQRTTSAWCDGSRASFLRAAAANSSPGVFPGKAAWLANTSLAERSEYICQHKHNAQLREIYLIAQVHVAT